MYKEPLTKVQAEKRFALFSPEKGNLHYEVFLKLTREETYQGVLTATILLSAVSDDLFFDAALKTITKLTVNEKVVEAKDGSYAHLFNDRFLSIPKEFQQVGKNVVKIEFDNNYVHDGNGLHSFVDTDKKHYVYSNFCPYHANKMIPCFDQPDLKGTWKLDVAAPAEWIAIANEPVDETHQFSETYITKETLEKENLKYWSFQRTKPLSTYLFCLIAGPYLEIKSKETYNNIQMSLFCRESLHKYLVSQAEEIFEITRVCMAFYESFFGYPFPFTKYDQIFCPEFNWGAMENPGCVIFNDRLVFKDQTTEQRRTSRAITTTHELAHMWFGDLVTMKWWNDLWLNESFAEFISHFALNKIRGKLTHLNTSDVWLEYFRRKCRGYREDQQPTTHPINGEIPSTHQAETIFDGITYNKGAACLKQIIHLIGEENFSKSMGLYFNKFAFSNATLHDFISALQENYKPLNPSYPENLDIWQKAWIQTAGLNELVCDWNPKSDEKTLTLKLKQSAVLPIHPTIRVHKMKIAFFDDKCELIEVKDVVVPPTETFQLEVSTERKPAALLMNYDDEAFIKVRIDSHSTEVFKSNLKNIKQELNRTLIWKAFFDMVRDALLTSIDFIDIVANSIGDEPGDSLLNEIFEYAHSAIRNYTPAKIRGLLNFKMFEITQDLLLRTDLDRKNRVVTLKENLISFAGDHKHRVQIIDWFNGEHKHLNKYPLGINDKWSIIKIVYAQHDITNEQKKTYFERVKQEDPSDFSVHVERTVAHHLLSEKELEDVWKGFLQKGTESIKLIAASMSGFNRGQKIYADAFFDVVLDIFRTQPIEYSRVFYTNLFPCGDDLETYLERTKDLLKKVDTSKEAWLTRFLKESEDDLTRRIKAYKCLLSSL